MIMIIATILALVLVYKSFCNTVCIYMVMQIKLGVVVVVVVVIVRQSHINVPQMEFCFRKPL